MNLRSGTRLGPYEIVALIGAGGMGEVYKARDTRLGRAVAVKILPAEFASDAKLKLRFEREAKAISALNHPHICTLHDIGHERDVDYLVMELCEGKTLAQKIEDGQLSIDQVLDYGMQIADALDKAHRKGIIHRDLKPSNIMLTKAGVKLLDFGLAKQVAAIATAGGTQTSTVDQPLTGGTSIAGTLQYLAPETLSTGQVDRRSDIWALGLVLYEMIGGRPAFQADSRAKLVAAILEHAPPPLTAANRDLEHIVSCCLRKDPEERWQSVADVAEGLRWLCARSPTRVEKPRARLRALLWSIAALALLAAGLAAFVLIPRRAKPVSFQRITFRRGVVTKARFAPDGKTVIFAAAWEADPLHIFVKRPESDDAVPLDLPPADLLSVSSSGELAILTNARRQVPFGTTIGTLARVAMNGGVPRPLVENVISADWSPDGRSIAIIRDTGREQRVEIRSADGGELIRQVYANASGVLGHLRFSPSGDRIAFVSAVGRAGSGKLPVVVVNSDGGEPRLIGSTVTYSDLVWSPDGRELWFSNGTMVQADVRATSVDALGERQESTSSDPRNISREDLQNYGSRESRTIFRAPGNFSFADIAGKSVLVVQNDVSARAFCRGPGDVADRDVSSLNWTLPSYLTADGKHVLLWSGTARKGQLASVDGSSKVDLTEDVLFSFSADQRAVLVAPKRGRPAELAFVPLGTGERSLLSPTKLDGIAWAVSSPDGKDVILTGITNNVMHLYKKAIRGPELRRISNDPIYYPWFAISPDSASVVAIGPTQRLTMYRVATGESLTLPTSVPGDFPITYAADGSLLFARSTQIPNAVYRFEFETGRETFVREIVPAERAGVLWACPPIGAMSGDGKTYCYQCAQVLSKLVIARGLEP